MTKLEWEEELKKTRENRQGIGMYVLDSFDKETAELLTKYDKKQELDLLNFICDFSKQNLYLEDQLSSLADSICELVSITEDVVDRKHFETLDQAGATVIGILQNLQEIIGNHPEHYLTKEKEYEYDLE